MMATYNFGPVYILHGLLDVMSKHTARGNIAWLTGSDVRTSYNFARSFRNVNGFNGIN